MNRREFLSALLVGGPLVAAASKTGAAENRPFMVVLRGVDPSSRPERIASAIEEMLSRSIPIGIAIGVEDADGNLLQQRSALASLLRRLTSDHPGLIEPVVYVPGVANETAYFQARRVSEAQTVFSAVLRDPSSAEDIVRVRSFTLLTEEPSDPSMSLGHVRTAGFRTVLLLPGRGGVRGSVHTQDVIQVHGGFDVAGQATADQLVADINSEVGDDPTVIYLTLSNYPDLTDDVLSRNAADLANAILATKKAGGIHLSLPSDLHRRAGMQYSRDIAVRVDASTDNPNNQDLLVAELRLAGIPFSYAGVIQQNNGFGTVAEARPGTTFCPVFRPIGAPDEIRELAHVLEDVSAGRASDAACVVTLTTDANGLIAVSEAGGGSVSPIPATPSTFTGLDHNGLVHLPPAFVFGGADTGGSPTRAREMLSQAIGWQRDALLVVPQAAIETPAARRSVLDAIKEIARETGNKLVNIDEFQQVVMPVDAAFDLLRSSKRKDALLPLDPGGIEPAERAQLINDAEIAWRYFARLTDPRTGLLPATALLHGDTITSYPLVAMWDVGSMLLGLIGAHSIGIIGTGEFTQRTAVILDHILDTSFNGLRLPRLLTSIRETAPDEGGFDASDTGRLLIALKVLDTYTANEFAVGKIVERWNLAETLLGRRLHSVKGGGFVDVHSSNYTNYLVRGFEAWGFDVEPAYMVPPGVEDTDAEMRLVNEVAGRGPVGAEPHVLEEVELGYSDVARTIAGMLATAQSRAYATTGRIFCVSEGALDRDPWSSYQGFQFGANNDPWTVDTIDNLAKYKTPAFRSANLLTNTKAAFLWAATRPDAYSRVLLAYVRERARILDLGYASGIYAETGEATVNYSDVNTNSVILESIAYLLGGRKPLLSVREGQP